eukprot:6177291-Pleurochrysis_carterae.AAC.1
MSSCTKDIITNVHEEQLSLQVKEQGNSSWKANQVDAASFVSRMHARCSAIFRKTICTWINEIKLFFAQLSSGPGQNEGM